VWIGFQHGKYSRFLLVVYLALRLDSDITPLREALSSTVCVTCVWAGVDNAWEQEKLEARKMLLNRADSHTSGARFVSRRLFADSLFLRLRK